MGVGRLPRRSTAVSMGAARAALAARRRVNAVLRVLKAMVEASDFAVAVERVWWSERVVAIRRRDNEAMRSDDVDMNSCYLRVHL